MDTAISNRKIMRLPEVIDQTGYKRSSIYKFIKEGSFPAHKRIGLRAVGWDSEEIQAWIDARLSDKG